MTAMPWGQKKRMSEIIQSQTVTPPFAAIEGTTFRLKTATTKSSTRSQRPRTRRRCGVAGSATWACGKLTSFDMISPVTLNEVRPQKASDAPTAEPLSSGAPHKMRRTLTCLAELMSGSADEGHPALLLGLSQSRRDFVEHSEMLVDVGLGVLHRDRPLLVPPIRLWRGRRDSPWRTSSDATDRCRSAVQSR